MEMGTEMEMGDRNRVVMVMGERNLVVGCDGDGDCDGDVDWDANVD